MNTPVDRYPAHPDDGTAAKLESLQRSAFRAKFNLGGKDRAYIADKGLETIADHARAFVTTRLSPAAPKNDGRQTPMRGHPAFVAQHATATCCRKCLEKWHGIPRGRRLGDREIGHIVSLIMAWIHRQCDDGSR